MNHAARDCGPTVACTAASMQVNNNKEAETSVFICVRGEERGPVAAGALAAGGSRPPFFSRLTCFSAAQTINQQFS